MFRPVHETAPSAHAAPGFTIDICSDQDCFAPPLSEKTLQVGNTIDDGRTNEPQNDFPDPNIF
jgi:hypothetical protein